MVSEWKIKLVEELAEKMKKAKTIAIANFGRIPSKQFQEIRKDLRGKAEIKVVKKRLLKKALEKAKLEKLIDCMAQQPAIIFSNLDPFELFREIKARRAKIPAKPGMVATSDIIVPAGGTGLPPGPAIGDLQAAGIPAKIEKGQIIVIKDTVVAKAGDVITERIANALQKLGIMPFEIGLEITGAYSEGVVFSRDVLDVSIEKIRKDFERASQEAFNLAFNVNYPVREVVELKLCEASQLALNLALNIDWISKETIEHLISKAHAHASILSSLVGGG